MKAKGQKAGSFLFSRPRIDSPETYIFNQKVADQKVRALLSEMGAPCCPKGCVSEITYQRIFIASHAVIPISGKSCSIRKTPYYTKDLTSHDSDLGFAPHFICHACKTVWDVDVDAMDIDWVANK